MSGNLAPVGKHQFFDDNGNPLSGGKMYAYQAGTSTPQNTYTDSSLGTPNANPVILDAAGRANIWLDPSLSYKLVLKDSGDVQVWSVDGIIGLLTANAVVTASIQDGAVTTSKLAANAVDSTKLASDASVDANRAVNTNNIRDAAVTRAKLAIGAVANRSYQSKIATFTASTSDDGYLCDATTGAITANLPAASGNSGKEFIIMKTDSSSNAVTVDGNASETIRGATTYVLSSQYEGVHIGCDGSNWVLIGYINSSIQTPGASAPAGGMALSASAVSQTLTNSTTWTAITGLDVTLATRGRPVMVGFTGAGEAGGNSYIEVNPGSGGQAQGAIRIKRGGTVVYTYSYMNRQSALILRTAPSSFFAIDVVSAGSQVYTFEFQNTTSGSSESITVQNIKAYAIELK